MTVSIIGNREGNTTPAASIRTLRDILLMTEYRLHTGTSLK
jgi:hypothetical protein